LALILEQLGDWGTDYHPKDLQWMPTHKAWDMDVVRFLRHERSVILEMTIKMGESMLSSLGARFLAENRGRFVAISLSTGKVVANAQNLESLNAELVKSKVKEDWYVARVGYEGISEII